MALHVSSIVQKSGWYAARKSWDQEQVNDPNRYTRSFAIGPIYNYPRSDDHVNGDNISCIHILTYGLRVNEFQSNRVPGVYESPQVVEIAYGSDKRISG